MVESDFRGISSNFSYLVFSSLFAFLGGSKIFQFIQF